MRFLIQLLVFSALYFSCSEKAEVEKKSIFSLSADSLSIGTQGGVLELDVTSDILWAVVDTSNWCTAIGDQITGKGKITISIDENTNEFSRETVIFVYSGKEEAKVFIQQEPFIHPALLPLNLDPKVVLSGNETFDTLARQPLMIAEIMQIWIVIGLSTTVPKCSKKYPDKAINRGKHSLK